MSWKEAMTIFVRGFVSIIDFCLKPNAGEVCFAKFRFCLGYITGKCDGTNDP